MNLKTNQQCGRPRIASTVLSSSKVITLVFFRNIPIYRYEMYFRHTVLCMTSDDILRIVGAFCNGAKHLGVLYPVKDPAARPPRPQTLKLPVQRYTHFQGPKRLLWLMKISTFLSHFLFEILNHRKCG
jgi:hypothetical protein